METSQIIKHAAYVCVSDKSVFSEDDFLWR